MREKCPDCGAIVGLDILSLPHICKMRDKLKNMGWFDDMGH